MAYKIKLKNPKKETYYVEANNKEQALHFFEEQELIVNHAKENDSFAVDNEKKEESNKSYPKYLIEGYRWFDRKNGNTYHKVIITNVDTGEEVHRSKDIVYGYGDQWRYTAYKELEQKGLVKKEDQFNHDLNAKRFIYREHDVDRKKDLP